MLTAHLKRAPDHDCLLVSYHKSMVFDRWASYDVWAETLNFVCTVNVCLVRIGKSPSNELLNPLPCKNLPDWVKQARVAFRWEKKSFYLFIYLFICLSLSLSLLLLLLLLLYRSRHLHGPGKSKQTWRLMISKIRSARYMDETNAVSISDGWDFRVSLTRPPTTVLKALGVPANGIASGMSSVTSLSLRRALDRKRKCCLFRQLDQVGLLGRRFKQREG